MKNVLSSIGSILFYVMTCGLFVYAASRSLDFIQSTLPPDQKLIGYLGLLATEGGAVIWLIVFLRQASGVAQKAIAAVSAVIDMLGGIGMFTIDTLLRSGQAGTIVALTKDDIHNAILVLSGLIGFNLICAFAFHIVDPFNIARMQEESAHDTLQSELLKHIEENAAKIAGEMLPDLAAEWERDFKGTFGKISTLNLGKFNHRHKDLVTFNSDTEATKFDKPFRGQD